MERTCQFSYPRNSANASPPGTFTVYLSWADRALPPTALTMAVTIAIVPKPLLFITGSSFVKASTSAHRFLHERDDPCFGGGGQLLQGEGDRPHGAFVEVRLVAEAERRVPRLELVRALEEADDLVVLAVRGHPVPGSRREGWRAGFDDGMEPLGHGAIRFRHLGNLREHVAFPVRLVRARAAVRFRLQLLDTLLHRGSFLVRESLGGLPCIRLWAHRASLKAPSPRRSRILQCVGAQSCPLSLQRARRRALATFFILLPRPSDRKEDVQGRCLSTFLRRPVAAILVQDEARYRSTRIANKGDLCVHALGEEVVVALGPKLRRGAAYARPDMERPVLQRDVELQA